jgi:hypothetical protein
VLGETGTRIRRANEVVDEFARSAVLFEGKKRGMNHEEAVHHAFEAMVDYNNLDPFERSVVRAVVPFYSWQKGILKVSLNLAIDHPLMVAITSQLADLNREMMIDRYGADLPRAYDGFTDFPVIGTMNTRGLNPFEDAQALASPEGIAASINPFYEIAARKVLGAPEMGIYSDDLRLNDFGLPQGDVNVGESLQYVASGVPQVRAAESGRGLKQFFGLSAYSDKEVDKIAERTNKARELIHAVTNEDETLLGAMGSAAGGKKKRPATGVPRGTSYKRPVP